MANVSETSVHVAKSKFAEGVDQIQTQLTPFLKERGFRRRGRTYNAPTSDSLTCVVNLQMGASDPPGTTYIPELRENLHGYFTVNLGVYVPEVAKHHGGGEAKAWVQDYHCCIRARLGEVSGHEGDLWWPAVPSVVSDVASRLERAGLPFLERFTTRQRILDEFAGASENRYLGAPRIISAILLAARGEPEAARKLLSDQSRVGANPAHPAYVRDLARRLGLGELTP